MPTPSTTAAIPAAVDTRTDAERAEAETAAAAERDRVGATLTTAEGEGGIETKAGAVLTPENTPELEGTSEDWSDVLIVANAPARMPPKGDRKVIVAEARSQPDEAGVGAGQATESTYPKSADAYVGYAASNEEGEAARIFPDAGAKPVFLMGQNVKQFGIGGVSRQTGYLSVGPGHPVYVAVNLALQKGARTVEVHGLTDYDKATLGPWLDKIVGEFESLAY